MTTRKNVLRSLIISCLLCGTVTLPAFAAVTVTGSITQAETTGNSDTGSASGNTLNVTNATQGIDKATIYGGKTADEQAGSSANNTVTVSNSNIQGTEIIGGSSSGVADSNTVIIESTSKVGSVLGGANNTATNNRVEMYGSSGNISGGFTDAGDANGNYVLIDTAAGTVGMTHGGNSLGRGDANDNTVEIKSGTVNQAIGGSGKNTANNRVIMSGGTDQYMLVGGYANGYGGTSSNNHVSLSGGEITYSDSQYPAASGGWAPFGNADQNSVEISGTASVTNGNVYGGGSLLGTATNNTVKISGGTVGGRVAGGAVINYTSVYGTVSPLNSTGNSVEIGGNATVSSNVYGGYVSLFADSYGPAPAVSASIGNASQNTVKISDVTLSGNAYGGYTESGTASDNTVSLTHTTASTPMQEIVGGRALIGTASGNTVTVEQGSYFNVFGGATGSAEEYQSINAAVSGVTENGDATGNTLIVKGGTIFTAAAGRANGLVYTDTEGNEVNLPKGDAIGNHLYVYDGNITAAVGGYGGANVKDNTATMTGGTAARLVGGAAIVGDEGTISGNHVSLSGGTVTYYVIGGEGAEADGVSTVSDNSVAISGGTVAQNVAAGTTVSGDAIGNTLTISGGTIGTTAGETNYIVGGASVEGAANDNTVTITGGTLGSMMSLYGGFSDNESTGNTLNLYTKANTVKNLDYFQNLNFYVPEATTAGETMLTVTDTADVSNATVLGGVQRTTKLQPGDVINLIYDANAINTENTQYGVLEGLDTVTSQGYINHKVITKKWDANTIVLTIPKEDKGSLDPDTKVIPEDREHSINMLKNAADLLTDEAYRSAATAWEEGHSVEAKFVPYAVLGGHNLRYETGSYVDSDGMATNIGFVRRIPHTGHTDTIMPFFEYGMSHYDSHLDNGARGDGKQHYTGAGLLMRRDQADGLYYEGALRAGRVSGDFRGIIADAHASYNTNAPYVAAQAGIGKIIGHGRDTYDYYGKFFWSHLGSDTTTVHSVYGDANYDLDSINSYRTRLGMRWTRNFDERRAFYAGLGWDYEFDSEANATYQGWRTESPTVKGSSGFLELGWRSKITQDNPWGVDLRLTGWAGKQHGATYYATISRAF